MSVGLAQAWDARVERLLAKLPRSVRDAVEWLPCPRRRWAHIAAACLLVVCGILAILPVLGLWMLPLGLALAAEDMPGIKPWLERCARRVETEPCGRPAEAAQVRLRRQGGIAGDHHHRQPGILRPEVTDDLASRHAAGEVQVHYRGPQAQARIGGPGQGTGVAGSQDGLMARLAQHLLKL
jgi:hypothetical protein